MKYILPIFALLTITSVSYAFLVEVDPNKIIEQKNREAIIECLSAVQSQTWSIEMKKEMKRCIAIPLLTIWTGNLTPISGVPWQINQKYSINLEWSNDYATYYWIQWAGRKNNNTSWLTYWVSNTLKWLWTTAWINYSKGTLRPEKEWWNYIRFDSIQDGIRAKVIAIRDRWGKATVKHFLAWWWTGYIPLSFDTSKKISELNEDEFAELFIQQMKKETPGMVTQLLKDGILIIK